MKPSHQRSGTKALSGFSVIELMISTSIVTIVFAVAMQATVEMVQRKAVENNKIDLVQSSREFMDQITNDIHESGYPSYRMFNYATMTAQACGPLSSQMYVGAPVNGLPGTANSCPWNIAVGAGDGDNGLVNITQSSIQFESDVDGTGVSEVFIQLVASPGFSTACTTPPCVLQRGIISKQSYANGGTVYYYTELNNVMNTAIFTPYDYMGNAVTLTPPVNLGQITDIGITIYVQASSPDPKTKTYPTATMVSDAKIRLD